MKTCSVIVPIYNAAPYLAQCLSSIKMQTYRDLQVILVNDGSTDESAAIAQSFVDSDSRFTLLEQTNQGQAAARNRGMKQATGEYLTFVDADDYMDVDFIEQHIAALGSADYIQSGYRRVLTNGTILEQKRPCHRYQFTTPWGRLYRTSYFRQHQISFPEGMIYEDVIFSLAIWGSKPHVKIMKYIGYNYTYNSQSTTSTPNHEAQRKLFHTIHQTDVALWLKIYIQLRLFAHFLILS